MNRMLAAGLGSLALLGAADAVTLSNSTTIAAGDATYDGQNLTIDACSVTMNGAHSFTGLQLINGAVLTHSPASAGQADFKVDLSVSGNVLIDSSSKVDAEGKGYAADAGPGAGQGGLSGGRGGGGGHGGNGSDGDGNGGAGGIAYGSPVQPTAPGSGGGYTDYYPVWAAEGGGVVRIEAGGTLQVDGSIIVDGFGSDDGYYGGGSGAGGSIWLSASNFTGSGILSARGGNPWGGRGVGAGGRIAVYYGVTSFTGTMSAAGGIGSVNGGAGTVYLKPASEVYGELIVDNASATNGCAFTPLGGIATCRTTIRSNAVVWVDGSVEFASLNLLGTAQISHTAELLSGATISVLGDAVVASGAVVDVSGKGYAAGSGPGAGQPGVSSGYGGGAGHGGDGSDGAGYGGLGGLGYGSVTEPVTPGSGGGASAVYPAWAAPGGGVLRLDVGGTLQVDGAVRADGFGAYTDTAGGGAGAGGSIWLSASNFTGSGTVSAVGGNPWSNRGAGGGGRIAVYYQTNTFAGVLAAQGGRSTSDGGAGTVYLKDTAEDYGTVFVDNAARTNHPALTRLDSLPVSSLVLRSNAVLVAADSLLVNNLEVLDTAAITHVPQTPGGHITVLGDALVASGGAIDMDEKGFPAESGPGAGWHVGDGVRGYGSGAGHGGTGGIAQYGDDIAPGGLACDSETAPVEMGSGGGSHLNGIGGTGGGAIRLTVGGTLTVDGVISADAAGGENAGAVASGGGSGGSIYLAATALSGTGRIAADGGNAYYTLGPEGPGGGAGGRIALHIADTAGFSGSVSVAGGTGTHGGQAGTIYWGTTNTLPQLQVVGHSPTGTLLGPVEAVDVRFENALDVSGFTSDDVAIMTPGGALPTGTVSVAPLGGDLYRISFPAQVAAGTYQLTVGPDISDLFGNPMGSADVIGFTLRDPCLAGTVAASNGWLLAGVGIAAGDGSVSGSTGTDGAYRLSRPLGWSGTLNATLAGAEFTPAGAVVGALTGDVAGIDFLLSTPLEPQAGIAYSNANLLLDWTSVSNLYYQLQESTNLADWVDVGGLLFGSGLDLSTNLVVDPDADSKFYRMEVTQ